VIDGSDPNVSNTAVSAAQGVGQAHSVHILQEALVGRLDSAPGVDVHPRVWYNLGLSGIFLLTSLGFGILISTVSKTQQEAMLLTFFIMLPSIFLSGYFFPVDAMPPVLQAFSQVIPVTYVLIIVRSIMPKGVGLEVLMGEVSALVAFGGVVLTLSTARFRKRLD
jgi:ABC-2 type transport system permease protein